MNKIIKHFTSSIFIFYKFDDEWKLLFVHHKKLDKWMIPGGHVENDENPLEAAKRETMEETGLRVKFISFIHEEFEKTESEWILPPENLLEEEIAKYGKDDAHIHLDCIYIAIAEESNVMHDENESLAIKWFSEKEVGHGENMFLSTQKLGLSIFEKLKSDVIEKNITYIQR